MGYRFAQRLLLVTLLFALSLPASGETVDREKAKLVCQNWLTYLGASATGDLVLSNPHIYSISSVTEGDTLLAWHFELRPRGYVIVPARDELPPIFAASDQATWPGQRHNPFLLVARDVLAPKIRQLNINESDASSRRQSAVVKYPVHDGWERYAAVSTEFESMVDNGELDVITSAGPLLTTRWHQDYPFNNQCPISASGRTFVGCTATATAQLMRYHQWPPMGTGVYGYTWNGDNCDDVPTAEYLEVDLGNPYDWSLMPDEPGWTPTPEQRDALAEFNYEVAVACRMDFSFCGSAASQSLASSALRNLFYYAQGIREVTRFRYTDQAWFDEIRNDVDAGQPVIYSTIIHTMVCDGWRQVDGMNQIHLNYGWGGASDNWYTLDDIETSANPWAERMLLDIRPDSNVTFPVDLTAFEAFESLDGMHVDWEVPASSSAAQFWLLRSGGANSCVPLPLTFDPLTGQTVYQYIDQTPDGGEYSYWLQARPPAGEEVWFGPVRAFATVGVFAPSPAPTRLAAPVPNPANPRTTVAFALAEEGLARLRVLDVRGRVVRTLVDRRLRTGDHEVRWDGRGDDGRALPSATYVLRLEVEGENWTRKVVLAR